MRKIIFKIVDKKNRFEVERLKWSELINWWERKKKEKGLTEWERVFDSWVRTNLQCPKELQDINTTLIFFLFPTYLNSKSLSLSISLSVSFVFSTQLTVQLKQNWSFSINLTFILFHSLYIYIYYHGFTSTVFSNLNPPTNTEALVKWHGSTYSHQPTFISNYP